jgi:hypothetical protein
MTSLLMDVGKWWLEWRGRGNVAPRYNFEENEIVSPPYPRKVKSIWKATFLNLHPTHYALAVAPDGSIVNLKGGYNLLSPGKYNIYYVDKQNRVNHLPRTVETTSDGFQVAIVLAITYRVIDPHKALNVQDAVDTLVGFIKSDLREFIRSHQYDNIVGDSSGPRVDDEEVALYIKIRHSNRHQMSKLFSIADVVVQEKIGDPRITEQREKYQMSQRQLDAQKVLQTKNQDLEQTVANQGVTIQKIKAQAEVDLQSMTREMQMQKIEIDRIRRGYQNQQEISKTALETIFQSVSNPTYPPDPREFEIIKDLINELLAFVTQTTETTPGQVAPTPNDRVPNPRSEKISKLTRMLSNWQKQKPPP